MVLYKLAIIDATTNEIIYSLTAGGRLEQDLIDKVVTAMAAKPVGLFATKATVLAAVQTSLQDVITALKNETRAIQH